MFDVRCSKFIFSTARDLLPLYTRTVDLRVDSRWVGIDRDEVWKMNDVGPYIGHHILKEAEIALSRCEILHQMKRREENVER